MRGEKRPSAKVGRSTQQEKERSSEKEVWEWRESYARSPGDKALRQTDRAVEESKFLLKEKNLSFQYHGPTREKRPRKESFPCSRRKGEEINPWVCIGSKIRKRRKRGGRITPPLPQLRLRTLTDNKSRKEDSKKSSRKAEEIVACLISAPRLKDGSLRV